MGWNLQLGMKQKVVGSQNLTLEATISSWKQTSFFSTGHWVELWWSAYQSLWEKTTMDDETWLSTHFFPLQQCPTPVVSVETCLKRSKHIKTRGFFTKWFFLVGYLDCRFFTVFHHLFVFTVGPCGGVASALYGSLQYPGAKPGTTRGRFGDPKNIPMFPSSLDEIQGSFLDPWDKSWGSTCFFHFQVRRKILRFQGRSSPPKR